MVPPDPHERRLADSSFPGDDGSASDLLRSRLRAAADGSAASYLSAVAALGAARLLVPVVAEVTRSGAGVGGLASDKEAEMAVVGLQTPDGRRAAVAFTGLDSLASWHPQARPVPITIDKVAAAALDDQAVVLIIDPAGPASLALEAELLTQFADGHRLVILDDGGFGWLRPAPDDQIPDDPTPDDPEKERARPE